MTPLQVAKYLFLGACCAVWAIGTYIVVSNLKARKDAHTLKQYRKAWDWTCDNIIGPLFLAGLILMSLLLLTGFAEP